MLGKVVREAVLVEVGVMRLLLLRAEVAEGQMRVASRLVLSSRLAAVVEEEAGVA